MIKRIRKYKWTLLVTSVITLLPVLAGLLLAPRLPERFATHWNMAGEPDGYSGLTTMLVMPFAMLAGHWICLLTTAADPKNARQSDKAFRLVIWIMPCVSVLMSAFVYANALGASVALTHALPLVLGLAFMCIGNYLPKCSQNRTLGIRVYWTLRSEENWNATHRFAGYVWTIGGAAMMLSAFLPENGMIVVLLGALLALCLLSTVYSYLYFRRQVKAGTWPGGAMLPHERWNKWVTILVTAVAALALLVSIVLAIMGKL